MAIIQGNAKQGSTRGFYPKTIEGSLRFNDDDSAYLSWTPDSAGNRKTWTWSGWVKRGNLGGNKVLFAAGVSGDTSTHDSLRFNVNDNLQFLTQAATGTLVETSAAFRDPSAWYHVVLAHDSTQATSTNRVKIYVNGQLQTTSGTYPTLNVDTAINNNVSQQVGARQITGSVTNYLDGYLAEVHFLNGIAAVPEDFGELKNGVWVAKTPDVTYGTNGFYLNFQDDTEVEAFNTVLWRGDGLSSSSVTGMGFEPDLVWIKARDGAYNHILFDSVRGVGNYLASSQAYEENWAGNLFPNSEPTTDGFIVDGHLNVSINESGKKYVAWGWKAGGAPTVDNSAGAGNVPTAGSVKIDGVNSTSELAGSIAATRLSASTTYGFSICDFTMPSEGTATIGHGLGTAPSMIILKARNVSYGWAVYHESIGNERYLELHNANGQSGTSSGLWNSTSPTSDVFSVGASFTNGYNYIAYCWAEKSGYSKFSSYSGSASDVVVDDLGFTPAMIIIKRTDTGSTGAWITLDNTRDVANPKVTRLFPNDTSGDSATSDGVTFDPNGFTVKATNAATLNGSGNTYIYAAFADTREAAFWLDQSGNDNDWQPVNLDHNDTVADSPTDNFATWNGVVAGNFTLSEGNLKSTVNTNRNGIVSSIGFDPQDTDGYKAEFTINTLGNMVIGLADETFKTDEGTVYATTQARAVVYGVDGTVYDDGSSQGTFSSFTAGDVVTMYVKSGSLYYAVNGTLANSGSPVVTGISDDKVFWLHALSGASSGTLTANFGQQPFVHTTSLDS